MEYRSFIDTFLDYADAFVYTEKLLLDYSDWEIEEASITYVNYQWRVGMKFRKKDKE